MFSSIKVLFLVILSISLGSSFILPRANVSHFITSIPGPIINTQYGPVQGREEFYEGAKSVYTYKGIRYAAPPTGNLRFRQAVAPTPWTQVFQAGKIIINDFIVVLTIIYLQILMDRDVHK